MMTDLRDSLSSIWVYKRGWRTPIAIDCSGIVVSAGVNAPGRLSAIVPLKNQRYTGSDWLGKWVIWEHPTFGRFAGYIEDAPIAGERGTIEIAPVGFVNILTKRRTIRRYRPASGPPGAIVARALVDIKLDAGMPFSISTSERGPQLTYEFRAESAMSVFDAMANASGQEWTATLSDTRELQIVWRPRVGKDETRHVTYTEGVNVISAPIDQTIANTVNDLLGIADDQQFNRAAGARIISAGSRASYGLMQDTRQYVGLVSPSTLGPRVAKDLTTLSLPTITVTLRIPHLDWRLAYIRDGTTFRYVSASANAVYALRVLTRDLDLDAGVVTLTCDGIADVTRAAQRAYDQYGGIATSDG